MLNCHYCNECLTDLHDYGEYALTLYEAICDNYSEYEEPFFIVSKSELTCFDTSIDSVLRFLELKKYVVSIDVGEDLIAVVPKIYEMEEGYIFCRSPVVHQNRK